MAQYGVSFVATVSAWDTANGTYKTGDAANITLYWNKDGTNNATSNACSEVSSANVPGQYKVTITAAEASCTEATLGGKSSTADIIIFGKEYAFDSYTTAFPVGAIPGLGIVDNGTAQAGSAADTLVIRSAAAFADDELVGHTAVITGGTGAGQSRLVDANVGATDTLSVSPDWATTPDNTSTYIIFASAPGSTTNLIDVNVASINGATVVGAGTGGNLWRG